MTQSRRVARSAPGGRGGTLRQPLLGTFEPEGERVRYGLTKNIDTFNPVRVAYHEFAAIARDVRGATRWRDRIGYLLRGPGWKPAERLEERRLGVGAPHVLQGADDLAL